MMRRRPQRKLKMDIFSPEEGKEGGVMKDNHLPHRKGSARESKRVSVAGLPSGQGPAKGGTKDLEHAGWIEDKRMS